MEKSQTRAQASARNGVIPMASDIHDPSFELGVRRTELVIATAAEVRQFKDYIEKVKQFTQLWINTRATNESSARISSFAATHHGAPQEAELDAVGEHEVWTDEKNRRRAELVDKEIAGDISSAEQAELDRLQNEMLAYRRKVAPLPLEEVRALHAELLRKARENSK